MAIEAKLADAWCTCRQAFGAILWSAVALVCDCLFWSCLGLLSEFFRFLHELLERLIALGRPQLDGPEVGPQPGTSIHAVVGVQAEGPNSSHQLVENPIDEHEERRHPACLQAQLPVQQPLLRERYLLHGQATQVPGQAEHQINQGLDISYFRCSFPYLHSRKRWYAVGKGKNPGIYECWEEAEPSVLGYRGNKHKSFRLIEEAEHWMQDHMLSSRHRE